MASQPPTEFIDGFSVMSGGMDSGVKPLDLPKNKYSYGTNTTCRGRYLTHRPPYRKQTLNLDAGLDLTGLRFQGACYYKPDNGAESIIAQIGGRLLQFMPDSDRSVNVYDRSVKNYSNGVGFISTPAPTKLLYSVKIQNISDAGGVTYPAGSNLGSDPSLICTLLSPANSVTSSHSVALTVSKSFATSPALQKNKFIYVQSNQFASNGAIDGKILSTDNTGANYVMTVNMGDLAKKQILSFAAGAPIFSLTNPSPPATYGKLSQVFTSPPQGQIGTIFLDQPFFGTVGSGLIIGTNALAQSNVDPATGQKLSGEIVVTGAIYSVIEIPEPSVNPVSVVTQTPANSSLQFSYDLNPASLPTAWLWQSENYVIVQNGQNRPIVFDGVSSRRSISPTFIGTNAESFSVPQIGQPVDIVLDSAFEDAVGTYISVSAFGLFPFLMRVGQVNGSTITAFNVNGQVDVGSIIPIGSGINSTASPIYTGVTITNIPGVVDIGVDQLFAVSPPVSLSSDVVEKINVAGNAGITFHLSDGAGPLSEAQFYVAQIFGRGSSLSAENLNSFPNPNARIFPAGTPVVFDDTIPPEIPIGRMGAYVQGRNWISSPDGKSFFLSDQVGSSAGTQALNYRDAVLKFSENTTQFNIPGGAGQINCVIALSALDASLGQGPLQVLCDNTIFTCSATDPDFISGNSNTPILASSVIGAGGTGQNAAVVANGDLIFKSGDATIRSLKLARQDFNQWGNLPISEEVNRIIEQENISELESITAAVFNNRAMMSCAPIDTNGGVVSQGVAAIDFDVTSSLQGKLPSVYDGAWKDGNFLQIVTGKFNKIDRAFAFLWNEAGNTVELWEFLKNGTADDDGTETPKPITWSFEGPMLFSDVKGKGEFDLVQLKSGELYFSELVGQASFKIWYRQDYSECWNFWDKFTVKNTRPEPSYFMRAGLQEPTARKFSDALDSTPANVARFYQIRVEVTGSLVFSGMACRAVPFAQNLPSRPMCE